MAKQKYKLRHIALSVENVAKAQKFFEDAFGMTKAGDAQNGIYMTDGTINVALLAKGGKVPGIDNPYYGVMHFGVWVDDLAQAEEQVKQAGAVHYQGRPPNTPNSYYEVKYRDPTGIIFDITASGWRGAVKNVKPAD
ncbi:MAG: glyoxalase [Betaproteobacteria bacterium RIFCSPLOWO2_02_FULL_67_26]|nr:MAG: glyoxalase [Betaproteobacteria bacterium RIFCSPLOWO2_02_FULL_67_26]